MDDWEKYSNNEAEKIIDAFMHKRKLMFMVKWKGIRRAHVFPAVEANHRFPQIVIKYYEERLVFFYISVKQ